MLTNNYHTHTYRCRHARDTEREYIDIAIQAGVRVLGFSDHTPYVFPGDYYSSFRMYPNQLEDYVTTLSDLRREYAGQIEIHIGLETEYYPDLFARYLELIKPYPIEYLLLAQHFLGNEIGEPSVTAPCSEEKRLIQYVDQVSEGMATGVFSYIAHPDIFRFEGDSDVYAREARRLCENAKRAGLPLEINLLGMRTNRHYPREDFFKVAGEVGNKVIYGLDAHDARDMCDEASFAKAEQMVEKFGLTHVQTLAFHPIHGEGASV